MALGCTSCAKTINASKNIITRSVDTPAFTAISTSTSIDIEYSQLPARSVIISAPDNIMDYVEVKVINNELRANMKGNVTIHNQNNRGVKIIVSAPEVTGFTTQSLGDITIMTPLKATGDVKLNTSSSGDINTKAIQCNNILANGNSAGDISINGVNCNTLTVKTDSSSGIKVSNIIAQKVRATASSAGDINLSGKCSYASLSATSAGDIRAENLVCVDVDASASSGGDVKCTATGNVNSSKSSGGNVIIKRH